MSILLHHRLFFLVWFFWISSAQGSTEPKQRKEASSTAATYDESCTNDDQFQWEEHFVVPELASLTESVGEALSKDYCYLSIPNFATPPERQVLVQTALQFHSATSDEQFGRTNTASYMEKFIKDKDASCLRFSVEKYLSEAAKQTSRDLVYRFWNLLRTDPELQVFAKRQMIGSFYDTFMNKSNDELWDRHVEWYAEKDLLGNSQQEPCVNLYFPPSDSFEKHHDDLSMTLLLLLTDLDEYEGGGTALFGPKSGQEKPLVLARPPAGTLLVWGTRMFHEALPVTEGMRSVLVGSFQMKRDSSSGENSSH